MRRRVSTTKSLHPLTRRSQKKQSGPEVYVWEHSEEFSEVRRALEARRNRDKDMNATVTSKGQMVIPAAVRKKYRIRKGTKLRIEETDVGILLRPVTMDPIDQLQGILANRGLPNDTEKEPDREIE